MSRTKVVVDEAAVKRLANSADVQRDTRRRAERVLDRAKDIAPVKSGKYRDGLHIEEAEVDGVAGVKITGSTEYDMSVEANDGVLSRALDASGGA